jgi:hypothetical protein
MAQIELTQTHMLIKLTPGEKIFGLHGDFKIPAALIRGAEVADKDVWKTFGMRIGTGFPGLLVYGHYWRASSKAGGPGGWTFALWRSNHPSLTLTLATAKGDKGTRQPYKRIVITHPEAQKLADTINDAIVAC